jgi:hypothetical protein
MMNEIDSLLSRYLKNWTAGHPVPADVRKSLLEKAAGLQTPAKRNVLPGIDYDFRGAEQHYRGSGNWLIGPFSQSRLYSFHFSTIYRMAT